MVRIRPLQRRRLGTRWGVGAVTHTTMFLATIRNSMDGLAPKKVLGMLYIQRMNDLSRTINLRQQLVPLCFRFHVGRPSHSS